MTYRSKVDWWIAALVFVGPAVMLFALLEGGGQTVLFALAFYAAIIYAVAWPCDYTFWTDHLSVRSGFIKYRVPYREIYRVRPTRNPLSSPAWSLDRLQVMYGKKWILVSPADKEGFFESMIGHAGLVRQGDELVMPD